MNRLVIASIVSVLLEPDRHMGKSTGGICAQRVMTPFRAHRNWISFASTTAMENMGETVCGAVELFEFSRRTLCNRRCRRGGGQTHQIRQQVRRTCVLRPALDDLDSLMHHLESLQAGKTSFETFFRHTIVKTYKTKWESELADCRFPYRAAKGSIAWP